MKKLLCFLLCLTLIFSSVSLCFATATDWDTSDQANLRAIKNLLDSGGGIYNMISTISSRLNTISNTLNDVKSYLFDDGHSIAYWTSAISTWMSPILNAIQQTPLDLEKIWLSLGYTTDIDNDGNLEYHPYLLSLDDLKNSLTNINNNKTTMNVNDWKINGHRQLLGVTSSGATSYNVYDINSDGTTTLSTPYWTYGTPIGNLALIMQHTNKAIVDAFAYRRLTDVTGYNSNQNVLNWGSLSNSTFTPSSATDGIYKYLASIQAPVARLSYVLANDQEIEARDSAAANQEAVVDNFIDSTGDGSTSPSDIGSVSDLSSGYKQNFGSDASVSGIFNIFDSNNMGWFSQETKNQLDTTTPTRLTKGSESETPLLDKQIDEIYNALGVKKP